MKVSYFSEKHLDSAALWGVVLITAVWWSGMGHAERAAALILHSIKRCMLLHPLDMRVWLRSGRSV